MTSTGTSHTHGLSLDPARELPELQAPRIPQPVTHIFPGLCMQRINPEVRLFPELHPFEITGHYRSRGRLLNPFIAAAILAWVAPEDYGRCLRSSQRGRISTTDRLSFPCHALTC